MSLTLLDTDGVIDWLKNHDPSVRFIRSLFARGDTLCTCDIVLAEVYAGLHLADRPAAEPFLSALTFLATTPAAARVAGTWGYDFARRGMVLKVSDLLIAATASQHGASVVTGNIKDYPMTDVTVEPLPRSR